MSIKEAYCRAHTNIALIKYWGKSDPVNIVPTSSSLSLTLDRFYTDTRVSFQAQLDQDQFFLNGQEQEKAERDKISRFLDHFRQLSGVNYRAQVSSYNHVPTAAGLASSASAYAALAGACREALDLDLTDSQLSRFARRGSGSATRSIFGGFVEWSQGSSPENSMAIPIDAANWDIGMVVIAVNKGAKKISSRQGMAHTLATSPFYEEWVKQSRQDLDEIKTAIAQRDFTTVGQIAEANAMRMHATTLAANPPFTYFEEETLTAIRAVQDLRAAGYDVYYTIDAGPNVKILCPASQMTAIEEALGQYFASEKIISTLPGGPIQILSEWTYDNND
ncbi:diphosphomevalonate decarboxylase [Aerococcus kribbianus]|uniref:diphosphomevalonate decarboxylase n=1 Tax=Aerococcus kribbianus TaxID=2999064 RepID=A0A9X3FMP1_9LACT|nr:MULTISPECIES: diphosphomevalonate decarboxylase [unclassified Aerococcus]MCZ0717069.1 diphosphomevalonate decarboxylase [Aerococcus sp. YH-aer221]MCZ0725357.1 diphosphomevalonate decarboxylase [Aerococcus sp. YH-aer222]